MTKAREGGRNSRVTVEELIDCPRRRTNRRSPICPGSFSGSTAADKAGFAS